VDIYTIGGSHTIIWGTVRTCGGKLLVIYRFGPVAVLEMLFNFSGGKNDVSKHFETTRGGYCGCNGIFCGTARALKLESCCDLESWNLFIQFDDASFPWRHQDEPENVKGACTKQKRGSIDWSCHSWRLGWNSIMDLDDVHIHYRLLQDFFFAQLDFESLLPLLTRALSSYGTKQSTRSRITKNWSSHSIWNGMAILK
jgi:hypothetical protein